MNEEVIFGIGGMGFVLVILTLITIIAVVVISQALKTARAKTVSMAEIARDEAYRKLAEEAVSVQRKMAEDQQKIVNVLAEMKERINAMERMLREID
jgi:Na+-transporting methylmalonyl-CoA/oxaloacetate decarboxylase gamma subunit